jgi:hypothetical protein
MRKVVESGRSDKFDGHEWRRIAEVSNKAYRAVQMAEVDSGDTADEDTTVS